MMMPTHLVRRTQFLVGRPLICKNKTAAKGEFIHDFGLAGFAMFETGGDFNNTLVNSIRSAMGMTS